MANPPRVRALTPNPLERLRNGAPLIERKPFEWPRKPPTAQEQEAAALDTAKIVLLGDEARLQKIYAKLRALVLKASRIARL